LMDEDTVEVSLRWQEEIQDALIRAEDERDAARLALNLARDEIAALKAGWILERIEAAAAAAAARASAAPSPEEPEG
jgi:hypothetical protein